MIWFIEIEKVFALIFVRIEKVLAIDLKVGNPLLKPRVMQNLSHVLERQRNLMGLAPSLT